MANDTPHRPSPFSRDLLVMAAATLFFAFMLLAGIHWGIPKARGSGLSLTSPAFFPYVTCGLGLVVSVLGLIGARVSAPASDAEDLPSYPPGKTAFRLALVLALFVANYLMLQRVGALVTSAIIFAGLMLLGGERRPSLILIASIAIPVGAYFVFRDLARVPLPSGILSF